ncbi:MAG: hypothetical protein ABIH76_04930 [Candidatus Bathyarchaeota archaeon]
MHGSQFDVTTGKKITGAILAAPPGVEQLPEWFQKLFQQLGALMAPIKTYDLETFEVKTEGDSIELHV